jgi:hypothetical protein
LWNGLAAPPTDLAPTNLVGIVHSYAEGTNGVQQVGEGDIYDASHSLYGYSHALLWTGTAASAVDLHPTNLSGFADSYALATDGKQQVGGGGTDSGYANALVWNGSPSSAVDLNPAGFNSSVAYGVLNGKQVGSAQTPDSVSHAIVWSSTAASAVDLHLLLPNSFQYSRAYNIDNSGNIFGIAFNSSDQRYHAIEWRALNRLSGDFNSDGVVDAADYTVWRDSLGQSVSAFSGADGNGNGMIDAEDYNVWSSNFGHIAGSSAGGAAASVPEPATESIVLIGIMMLCVCRRLPKP